MTDKKNDKPEKVPGHKHPDGRGGGSLTPVRTSEQGKALAEKRWGPLRDEANRGMVRAVAAVTPGFDEEDIDVDDIGTQAQAFGVIVEKQTELAISPDAKGSTQAARFSATAVGAPGFGSQSRDVPHTAIQQNNFFSAEQSAQALEMLEMIRAERRRRQDIVDADVVDAD